MIPGIVSTDLHGGQNTNRWSLNHLPSPDIGQDRFSLIGSGQSRASHASASTPLGSRKGSVRSAGLGGGDSSTTSRGSMRGQSKLHMTQVLHLIQDLLHAHEVRLCISLVNYLDSWEALSAASLGLSSNDFWQHLDHFSEEQRKRPDMLQSQGLSSLRRDDPRNHGYHKLDDMVDDMQVLGAGEKSSSRRHHAHGHHSHDSKRRPDRKGSRNLKPVATKRKSHDKSSPKNDENSAKSGPSGGSVLAVLPVGDSDRSLEIVPNKAQSTQSMPVKRMGKDRRRSADVEASPDHSPVSAGAGSNRAARTSKSQEKTHAQSILAEFKEVDSTASDAVDLTSSPPVKDYRGDSITSDSVDLVSSVAVSTASMGDTMGTQSHEITDVTDLCEVVSETPSAPAHTSGGRTERTSRTSEKMPAMPTMPEEDGVLSDREKACKDVPVDLGESPSMKPIKSKVGFNADGTSSSAVPESKLRESDDQDEELEDPDLEDESSNTDDESSWSSDVTSSDSDTLPLPSSSMAIVKKGTLGGRGGEAAKRMTRYSRNMQNYEILEEKLTKNLGQPSHRMIVHPNSLKRMTWDLGCLGLIVAESIAVPMAIGFDITPPETYFWFTTAFFALDILITFFTGFFKDGILVMRQPLIIMHYMRTYFLLDLFATLPWEVMFSEAEAAQSTTFVRLAKMSKSLRMLRLLRVLRVRALFANLEDLLESYAAMIALSLTKMFVVILMVCHWMACFWGFMGSVEKMGHDARHDPPYPLETCEKGGPCEYGVEGSPWIRRYGLEAFPSSTHYLIALQVSAGLLTGSEMDMAAGYGAERVYVIVMMLASIVLCSTMISQVMLLVQRFNQNKDELRDLLRKAKEFMASRKVPQTLQAKVKRYLEYQHKTLKQESNDIAFTDRLSPWLRLELIEHMNRAVIIRHPFFQCLPEMVLKRIFGAAQSILTAPGDVIMQRGRKAAFMCWVIRGQIRVLRVRGKHGGKSRQESIWGTHGKSIYLGPPTWIGDLCLFQDMVHTNTAVSVTHAEILMLTKDNLLALVKDTPKAISTYEEHCQIVRDGDLITPGIICKGCGTPGHTQMDCIKNPSKGRRMVKKSLMGIGNSSDGESRLMQTRATIQRSGTGSAHEMQNDLNRKAPPRCHRLRTRIKRWGQKLASLVIPKPKTFKPGQKKRKQEESIDTRGSPNSFTAVVQPERNKGGGKEVRIG